jgi:hypothetical protein
MYGINDFRRLQREAHHCEGLTAPQIAYLKNPAYLKALEGIADNPREMARLTVGLLKHMALDPTRGTQIGDFALGYDDPADETIYFLCHINRVSNFVGYFELPRGSEEASQLVKAIRENLESRMFKAARMSRRLERKASGRCTRISAVARKDYNAVIERLRPGIDFRDTHSPQVSAMVTAMYEQANEAFDVVYKPLVARKEARERAIGNAAFDTGFRGHFTSILGAFAVRYIMPQATV